MRILYTIAAAAKPGVGGHYYSLRTIAGAIGKSHAVMIICVGPHGSPVIALSGLPYRHVHFNGFDVMSTYRHIEQIVADFKPDVIHSFDVPSFLFVRVICWRRQIGSVFTKCGGENPRLYWPHATHFVLFSEENGDYFRQRRKYSDSKIMVIPNRVTEIADDARRLGVLRSMIPPNKVIFMRIAHFRTCYEYSYRQLFNLVNDLNLLLGNVCFLIAIGGVQDLAVFKNLARFAGDLALILTTDQFTLNAAQLLDGADFVLGTGRSLMEAAAKGKILLTPLRNAQYPLLVTKDNYDAVFRTNFSPRNKVEGYVAEKNFATIARAVSDIEYRQNLRSFSYRLFERYFNIDGALNRYLLCYRDAVLPHKRNVIVQIGDIVLHALYVFRICVIRRLIGL